MAIQSGIWTRVIRINTQCLNRVTMLVPQRFFSGVTFFKANNLKCLVKERLDPGFEKERLPFSPPLHLRGFPPSVKVLFYDLQVDSDVKCQFIVFDCHITLTCYVEFTCENIIRISAGHYFHYFAIKLQIIQCLY